MAEKQHQETASEEQAPDVPEEVLAVEVEEELAVEEESVDEATALRQELEQTKVKESEYLDGWQRARAELANARKRFEREQKLAYTNARADMLVRLLPVVDDFERAFETLPDGVADEPWLEGIQLIQHKFQTFLEQEGVALIEAEKQEFDPFLHQAATHEPSAEVPAGHIISEMQKGYTMGDRVLRPSVVRVSAGAPEEQAPPEPEEQVPPAPEDEAHPEPEA